MTRSIANAEKNNLYENSSKAKTNYGKCIHTDAFTHMKKKLKIENINRLVVREKNYTRYAITSKERRFCYRRGGQNYEDGLDQVG